MFWERNILVSRRKNKEFLDCNFKIYYDQNKFTSATIKQNEIIKRHESECNSLISTRLKLD